MQGPPPVPNTRFSGDPFLGGPPAMRQLVHESGQPNAALDLTDEPPRYSEESRQPLLPFSLPKTPEGLDGPRRGKWTASWMPPSAGSFDTLVSAPLIRPHLSEEIVPGIHHRFFSVTKYYRSFMRNDRLDKFLQGQPFWLLLYFCFNLALTLFNKMVLVKFPFPYTLTAIHALFGSIGCYILHERGVFTPARLSLRETLTLAMFSVLYAVNIAVSNLSLQLVTIPFHQVVRASSPLFTMILAQLMIGSNITIKKLLTLVPVIAGVGFTTYGDYYFTFWGLLLTLFGTFLAALKTVVTNMLQSGSGGRLKLHPLDLLMRMSPLAFIQCVLYGWASGELGRVRKFGATEMDRGKAVALVINGCIAFGLNYVSFTANKKAGPLTMTVAANVKQVLTMLLAVIIFNLVITPTNMIGILLTIGGGAWYATVEYAEKRHKASIARMTSLHDPPPQKEWKQADRGRPRLPLHSTF